MEPRLSQFGPSLLWLLSKEVRAPLLADLFQTTPENIRVIAHRSRRAVASESKDEVSLTGPDTIQSVAHLGIRPGPDEVVQTAANSGVLDALRDEITRTFASHMTTYQYLDGAKALRRLVPKIGYAQDSRRVALSALLHQNRAWLMVHAGRCDSADREARIARELWRAAYRESPQREYAEHFAQSGLIGSHALLLIRQPERAWKILDLTEDAAECIRAPLGSEHFRQRGVALFQLRVDERAIRYFQNAALAMERMHEARNATQLLMTGMRHISFLKEDCDRSLEVLSATRRDFAPNSLEQSVTLHWTAACGLLTDSPEVIETSLTLLRDAPVPPTQFGHQVTIRKLLALTPYLNLDPRLRRSWVRRTLYENAFRNG